MIDGDAGVRTPAVDPIDRSYLDTASMLPGSHYGARIGSNTALWALAIQREELSKRLSLLMLQNERRVRSARYAAIGAMVLGILSTGGAAIYTLHSNTPATPIAKFAGGMPNAKTAMTSRPKVSKTRSSVSFSEDPAALAEKHDAAPNGDQKPMTRMLQTLPGTRSQPNGRSVKRSRSVAKPHRNDALTRELIADRKRTRELNLAQLRKLTRKHRK